MFNQPGESACDIVQKNDWYQVNDEAVLTQVSQTILQENVPMVSLVIEYVQTCP